MPTNIDALVPWTPDFPARHPIFAPLRPWAEKFACFAHWPELADYQALFDVLPEPIRTHGGKPLRIVPQAGRPDCFERHYAPRIYLTGEIQTRTRNWHDFFQFLTWFVFAKSKAEINALHLPRAKARLAQGEVGRRTPLENTLSLFDEGGAVVVASDERLLQLVREFRWKELFWERRDEVQAQMACVAFGHAVYEKALLPYVGMTANAILLSVEPAFFNWGWPERLAHLDARLAECFARERYAQPQDLQPFPLLGMPGWSAENERETYYDNLNYFRPGRRARTGR